MAPSQESLFECAGATDVGKKRAHNEDVFLIREDLGLFVVCDGMGGHSAGEVAAGIAAQSIADFFESCRRDPNGTWPFKPGKGQDDVEGQMHVALRQANRQIREAAEADLKRRNMGTTSVVAWLTAQETIVGWTGDSRIYLFRAGQLSPVTEDHSLLQDMIRAGKLTPTEIENFPHKNVITRALGPSETVTPEVKRVQMVPGDILLLCCDGLHGMLTDRDMERIIGTTEHLQSCGQVLVDAANANGGVDNITCILVRRRK